MPPDTRDVSEMLLIARCGKSHRCRNVGYAPALHGCDFTPWIQGARWATENKMARWVRAFGESRVQFPAVIQHYLPEPYVRQAIS